MLARRSMDRDRDAEHWAAVEEATELLHEERFKEALETLRDVLRDDPTNPYAFFFLGQALYEVGELQPSRDAYQAALRLAPAHLGARVALTHVLRKLGETREAVSVGLVALEQAPTDGEVLYALGLAYLARGDNVAARRHLEAFLRAKPELETRLEVEGLLQTMDGGAKPPPHDDDDVN
jgi:tetratricopeptide (TPR) repeat protein